MKKPKSVIFTKYINGIKEEDQACRIGARLRLRRETMGMSMSELGQQVGLSADRIQKYENGVRKPRLPLLKELAKALGVDYRALDDPCVTTDKGFMFTLFEMEECYGLMVEQQNGRTVLSFKEDLPVNLSWYLNAWRQTYRSYIDKRMRAGSDEEADLLDRKYSRWKFEFPNSVPEAERKQIEKEQLANKIAALQRQLEELDKS